jgi:hypothetical protein
MKNFTNPLDNIHVALPCPANWDEMFGSDRKRFCGECKLNVYNLSDMTRREAEDLLINSEGRLCVRFFRRADGTVLTKNCPVGWQAVKQRASRVATAAFSMIAGLFSGLFAFKILTSDSPYETVDVNSITEAVVETKGDIVLPATAPPNLLEFQGQMIMGRPAEVGMPAFDRRQIKIIRNPFRILRGARHRNATVSK